MNWYSHFFSCAKTKSIPINVTCLRILATLSFIYQKIFRPSIKPLSISPMLQKLKRNDTATKLNNIQYLQNIASHLDGRTIYGYMFYHWIKVVIKISSYATFAFVLGFCSVVSLVVVKPRSTSLVLEKKPNILSKPEHWPQRTSNFETTLLCTFWADVHYTHAVVCRRGNSGGWIPHKFWKKCVNPLDKISQFWYFFVTQLPINTSTSPRAENDPWTHHLRCIAKWFLWDN